jgi:hypothetical protein
MIGGILKNVCHQNGLFEPFIGQLAVPFTGIELRPCREWRKRVGTKQGIEPGSGSRTGQAGANSLHPLQLFPTS